MKGWVGGCAAVCLVISLKKQEEKEELTQLINSEAAAPALCSAPARDPAH